MDEQGIVVVGIDGSEVAKAALVFAAQEADRRRDRLIVAQACRNPEPASGEAEVRPFVEILRREAIAILAAVVPTLDYRLELRAADPAELLVELGAGTDLLVVGTHRTGRLRGFVLGSVSQRVAAHATCPVVTISGEPEHPDGPIVLGASTSPGGLAALRFACRESELRGVPVRAIRSVPTEDWALSGPEASSWCTPDVLRDAARGELEIVTRTAGSQHPDVTVQGELSDKNPFLALIEAAADASLLVIGSRRDQDSALPHLGPVAAWLLHQAQCPLAVVGYSADRVGVGSAAAASAGRRD